MGLRITVPGAKYGLTNTEQYLAKTGITDSVIIGALNTFESALKLGNLWDKIDYLYPILGTTDQQVKWNFVNVNSGVISALDGTAIPSVIDKGLKITGTSPLTRLPFTGNYTKTIQQTGGHAMYIMNEALNPVSTYASPLENSTGVTTDGTFTLSGKLTSLSLVINGYIYTGTPAFTQNGAFGAVITGLNASFYGKGLLLLTAPQSSTAGATTLAASTCIGSLIPSHRFINTISLVSFGTKSMTDSQMEAYQTLCQNLISTVHGITF